MSGWNIGLVFKVVLLLRFIYPLVLAVLSRSCKNLDRENEKNAKKTRRRMARERRGAGSSLVSMEPPYYKTIY